MNIFKLSISTFLFTYVYYVLYIICKTMTQGPIPDIVHNSGIIKHLKKKKNIKEEKNGLNEEKHEII